MPRSKRQRLDAVEKIVADGEVKFVRAELDDTPQADVPNPDPKPMARTSLKSSTCFHGTSMDIMLEASSMQLEFLKIYESVYAPSWSPQQWLDHDAEMTRWLKVRLAIRRAIAMQDPY